MPPKAPTKKPLRKGFTRVSRNKNGEETVRHDVKGVPKQLYDALEAKITALKLETGVSLSMKEATVRGLGLALDELGQVRNGDELKRLYGR